MYILGISAYYHDSTACILSDYIIRRKTADYGIPLITDLQLAKRFIEAMTRKTMTDIKEKSWDEY